MEKLNKIERLKLNLAPAKFDLKKVNWHNLSEEERFYLKNYGIYNIKLRPNTFMIRLRFDSGIITPKQLLFLANLAKKENLNTILTARAQIELHNIAPSKIYSIWQKLQQNNFTSYQVLSDNIRAIITDPLDGVAVNSKIYCTPIIQKLHQKFIKNPAYIGTLPRKFNTAIIGRETPSFNPWNQDLLFALAKKENTFGFNIYLGGKNSEVAKDFDTFCTPNEVPKLFEAIIKAYIKFGLRGTRSKTRLFYLIQKIGMQKFKSYVQEFYKKELQSAGKLLMQSSSTNQDYTLSIERFGEYGAVDSQTLLFIAQKSQKENLTIRLSPTQEIFLFHPQKLNQSNFSSSKNPGKITACAGSIYCALSLWEIKSDCDKLSLDTLTKAGINVGFSGCLKGCGKHFHSDIGLIGLRTNNFGPTEKALRVYLGATQSPNPAPARLLFYAVPLRAIHKLFTVIKEDYINSKYPTFEAFSFHILNKYSQETLMIWYLLRQLESSTSSLYSLFFQIKEKELFEAFKKISSYPNKKDTIQIISTLSHMLWNRA